MPSFAIVAEGITDQIIIERMIEQLCGEDDIEVNFLQPSRDDTDKHHAPHGGWQLVFEYIQDRAADAFIANDFLIVQIDTDCGEHRDYGLPLTTGGVARDQLELVNYASIILTRHLSDSLTEENIANTIFAVSTHSLESWLLLILYKNGATMSGFDKLGRAMLRKDSVVLAKTAAVYDGIARQIKRKRLLKLVGQPDSLGVFLTRLTELCVESDKTADLAVIE